MVSLLAMIREDYLIRMVKQFAEALARLMKLREAGEHRAALQIADGLYDELGISRELVDVVDTPTLAGMLRDPERMRAAAQLCWEEGHVFRSQGDPLTAAVRYRRAHELLLEARALAPLPEDDTALFELSRLVPAWQLDERYRDS
ncbi:MAG: hypothetical protein M3680_03655 [Myxococcota bacterium]|nr:hypothetical protein [Myxococcota bacterium]